MVGQWLKLCLAILMTGTFYAQRGVDGALISADPAPGPDALSGSYSIVIRDYDWGAGVSRAILSLDGQVTEVTPERFRVTEEKEARENSSADLFATSGGVTIIRTGRAVTRAYLSDETGNPTGAASKFVTLELDAGPNIGSPFCLHPDANHYDWADPYQLVIDLAPGQVLRSGETAYSRLAIARAPTARATPEVDKFQLATYTYGGETLGYAHYAPPGDGERHPLLVWLHGLGEGGDDPRVALLGSRAANLAGEELQAQLGGAYLLVPQCSTMWLDDGGGGNTVDGQSRYTQALMALIRSYVSGHRWVDGNRVYVGGCSNGGYMALALLLEDPGYFAAAFPVCEAYKDSWLSDEDISQLSEVPLWFVHSALDQICPPEESTFATCRRLQERGAANLRLTRLGELMDEALDYRYNPHYAWVSVLSGRISDPDTGETMFHWLARQRR